MVLSKKLLGDVGYLISVKDKRNKEPYDLDFGTDLRGEIHCEWFLNGNAVFIAAGEGRVWVEQLFILIKDMFSGQIRLKKPYFPHDEPDLMTFVKMNSSEDPQMLHVWDDLGAEYPEYTWGIRPLTSVKTVDVKGKKLIEFTLTLCQDHEKTHYYDFTYQTPDWTAFKITKVTRRGLPSDFHHKGLSTDATLYPKYKPKIDKAGATPKE